MFGRLRRGSFSVLFLNIVVIYFGHMLFLTEFDASIILKGIYVGNGDNAKLKKMGFIVLYVEGNIRYLTPF